MIQRLNYLALKAADPAAAAQFAVDKMGLTLAHAAPDGTHYLKAHGIDPYSLVYKPGDEPGMDHVSYLVRDAAALEHAASVLDGAGVAVERVEEPEWSHAPSVRFRTPAGHLMELTTGVNTDVPVAHMVSMNGATPGPVVPDHVGLGGYTTPIPGLYLTGGGTHPGPSVSGIPGQIAARKVLATAGDLLGPRRSAPAVGSARARGSAEREVARVS